MLEADAKKKADGRDGYIGYSLRPSGENPVLLTVIDRMAALLAEQFGAQGATPASVNVRSLDATDTPPHGDAAGSPERVFEEEWVAGGVTHQSIAAWHWDNTKKVDWLYTCLLHIGQGVEVPKSPGVLLLWSFWVVLSHFESIIRGSFEAFRVSLSRFESF